MTNNSSLTFSAHEPYRTRLDLLANDKLMAQFITQIGGHCGWWASDRVWVRTYGRFFPGESPWAVLVFVSAATHCAKQELCVIEVFEEPPSDAKTDGIFEKTVGWLCPKRFPSDYKLPTLQAVLSEPGHPTVIRYRPANRCTLRFDYDDGQPSTFAKVFPTSAGHKYFDGSKMLWEASLTGAIELSVAQPIRWDTETNTLWQAQVSGESAKPHLCRKGTALAYNMGRAVGSLAVSGLKPPAIFGRKEQMQKSVKQGTEICRRLPSLTGPINQLWEALTMLHDGVPERPLVAIHGAPHPSQWLDGGKQLGLIDFDSFTMGDPELDIATFMSEVDYENPLKMQCITINRDFLAGYEAVAGLVDQRLLNAYCAHKRLSKALKCAYAIRADGDIRAEQALGRALMCVLG